MNLLGMLRKLGDRLGIIELSSASSKSPAPEKIQTRTVSLTELVMTIQITGLSELAKMPAELSVPFEDVFKAAGIPTAASGWTVERLSEFLKSDRVRKLDRESAQRETLSALAADKVDPADLIKDAISRDRALDEFEDFVAGKREEWRAAKGKEVQAFQQEQKRIEKEIAVEEEKWKEWRRRKRQHEREIAEAVGYLTDRQVISLDAD